MNRAGYFERSEATFADSIRTKKLDELRCQYPRVAFFSHVVTASLLVCAAVAQAQSEKCVPSPPGMVSWWAAEGNAADSSGPNSGLLAGNASYAQGKVGVAFDFTNGAGYALTPDDPSLTLGANGFSIELWVQFASLGGSRVFVAKDEGPGQTRKWMFYLNDGQLQFLVGTGATQTLLGSGPFNPVLYQWHHVAVTRGGWVFRFYVDGALSSTCTNAVAIPTVNAPLTIGQAENFFFMGGLEDEIVIYNRALSAAEIQGIYNADSAGRCRSPAAPLVITQPQDQTVFAGGNVTLSLLAAGSAPLTYQWQRNGINIWEATNPTATNATLVLTNAQPSESGSYSALVSNLLGFTASSTGLLTVLSPGSCLPAPLGMVSWWAAEGNSADSFGPNNGVLAGGASYAPGKVGVAFDFTSGAGYALLPDSPSLDLEARDFTIELWVQFASADGGQVVVAKDEGPGQTRKWMFWLNNGGLQFLVGNGDTQTLLGSGVFDPVLNRWYHVAVTRHGSVFSIYVNGALNSADTFAAAIPAVNAPLTLGQAENSYFLRGLEDEVTLYHRALDAIEIQAICSADSAGKCSSPGAPRLVTQPQSQAALAGANVTLSVLAAGSTPFGYQWLWNGTNIFGATNSSLTLTNASPGQSGRYAVVVTNPVGSATSSNATLAVYIPACVPVPVGVVGWWAGE